MADKLRLGSRAAKRLKPSSCGMLMNKICEELRELTAGLSDDIPVCVNHPDRRASVFCASCGSPLCDECVVLSPSDARCGACRPAEERLISSRYLPVWVLLKTAFFRPWALGFLITLIVFAGLIVFVPGLTSPRAPELPDWAETMTYRCPYLEKAFRMRTIGDVWRDKGEKEAADKYYLGAITASEKYLLESPPDRIREQVLLGIGRIRERMGATNEAIALYEKVFNGSDASSSARGVAAYYLACIYEKVLNDRTKALDYYKTASAAATSDGGFIDKFIDYHAGKQSEMRELYSIAALTDTATSASAFSMNIFEGIEKCSGAQSGKSDDFPESDSRTEEEEESLEIIKL